MPPATHLCRVLLQVQALVAEAVHMTATTKLQLQEALAREIGLQERLAAAEAQVAHTERAARWVVTALCGRDARAGTRPGVLLGGAAQVAGSAVSPVQGKAVTRAPRAGSRLAACRASCSRGSVRPAPSDRPCQRQQQQSGPGRQRVPSSRCSCTTMSWPSRRSSASRPCASGSLQLSWRSSARACSAPKAPTLCSSLHRNAWKRAIGKQTSPAQTNTPGEGAHTLAQNWAAR